jgi:hypothetical protein
MVNTLRQSCWITALFSFVLLFSAGCFDKNPPPYITQGSSPAEAVRYVRYCYRDHFDKTLPDKIEVDDEGATFRIIFGSSTDKFDQVEVVVDKKSGVIKLCSWLNGSMK